MTINELTQALQEKGYHWIERREHVYGYPCIYAVKDGKEVFLGTKNLILSSSLAIFKRNEAYTKL